MVSGLRLEDLSWYDLKCFVRHAPPDAAITRALDPEWWISPQVYLLRDANYRLAVLAWQQTEDGHKGRNQPKPQPLTEAEREQANAGREKYDVMSIEEADNFLGWAKPE